MAFAMWGYSLTRFGSHNRFSACTKNICLDRLHAFPKYVIRCIYGNISLPKTLNCGECLLYISILFAMIDMRRFANDDNAKKQNIPRNLLYRNLLKIFRLQ